MNIDNLKTKPIETTKGTVIQCLLPAGETIDDASDFLDIMANAGGEILAVEKKAFSGDFFNLKTGVAGEILQKVSNYRKKLMITGDFENFGSKNMQSFIMESNRGKTVLFVPDIESGVNLL